MSSDKEMSISSASSAVRKTHCLFCSLLCPIAVEFHERDVALPFYPQDNGRACSRGSFSAELLFHRDRLNAAYIGKGDERKLASISEAISHTADRLKALGQAEGRASLGSEVAVVVDGNLPCEAILKAADFAKNVLKTENFVIYLPPSDRGILEGIFASEATFFGEEDLLDCNAILAIGDPFSSHPPISKAIHDFRFKDRANRLLVADSYRGKTAEFTFDFYQLPPGGEDAFLLKVAEGLVGGEDKALLEGLPESGAEVSPQAADACREALAQAGKVAVVLALGWAKNPRAEKIGALAGIVAREKGGVLPLLLYGNAQGAYRLMQNLEARPLGALLSEIEGGKIKGLLSVGIDLASALPESLSKSLEGLEFLAQTASLSPFTVHHSALGDGRSTVNGQRLRNADVVIPTALFLEESGTVLDGSGRRRQTRALLPPPKGALSAGGIFDALAQELGAAPLKAEITDEILKPGAARTLKKILSQPYVGAGLLARPRATEDGRPYALLSEPSSVHFIEGSLTGRLRWPLLMEKEALIKMNPQDASQLNLRAGDEVLIKSGNAEMVLKVELSPRLSPGVLGLSAPFLSARGLFNCWIDEAGEIRLAPGWVNLVKEGE